MMRFFAFAIYLLLCSTGTFTATLTTSANGFNPNTGVGITGGTVLTAGDDMLTITSNAHIDDAGTLTNTSDGSDTLIIASGGTANLSNIGSGDLSGWSVIQVIGGATVQLSQSLVTSVGTVTIRSSDTATPTSEDLGPNGVCWNIELWAHSLLQLGASLQRFDPSNVRA